jgi:predicted Zn-dependent protease
MIDGMVYGEDPRQGFVENSIFFHPDLKFKFPVPPGWQLQNSPIQVQMAPKDGNALMIFTMAQQKTLEEAAQKTLADLKLTVLDSKRTTVNGFPAIAAISQQVSQNQQTGAQQVIKVMSYFIQDNNSIYVFHGVSDDANFNSFYRIFESTMTNFSRLTDLPN